jgi:hypothetical protein
LNSVSTNGISSILIRIGSGSFLTTGYTGVISTSIGGATGSSQLSSGFAIAVNNTAASNLFGSLMLVKLSGNDWNAFGVLGAGNEARSYSVGGSVSLSGTLDRLSLTTVNGTDTFDAGSINIMYEG